MQETMESMVGAQHFSCMDLKSGFWQVKMDEDSRQYTAFTVGSMGIYEFLRMPYGLCNTPATFQRLMQNCLGELNLTYALIYLDDVIVYSKTEDEHLVRLLAVLERFMENGLKLKPSKCNFEGVYLPVYSEYVEGSWSSCMLLCVCVWGKSTHFWWEGYPGENTKSFCFGTIRLDALLQQ